MILSLTVGLFCHDNVRYNTSSVRVRSAIY